MLSIEGLLPTPISGRVPYYEKDLITSKGYANNQVVIPANPPEKSLIANDLNLFSS